METMQKRRVLFASRFREEYDEFELYVRKEHPEIEIVGYANHIEELIKLTKEKKPEYIFSGYQFDNGVVFCATEKIRKFDEDVKIFVLTGVYDERIGKRLIKYGANMTGFKSINFYEKFVDYMRIYDERHWYCK